MAAGGCVRPIRLRGTIRDIDPATGESCHVLDTEDNPDKVIYLPCGDRRASVCPPCAETYRADTYQLIRAGLAGGKGVPESVAIHPCVFATFTAPSFGPVHTRVVTPGGKVARCRPRRKANYCPHGQRISCGQRHKEDDACLGRPLCPDCYDYNAAVVWNAHSGELWRRTVIAIRRQLDKLAKPHGARVRLSYAKVAEFQRRGLIHFHAIFRLDGIDPAPPRAHRPAAPGDHRRRARRRHPPGRQLGLVRHRPPPGQAEGLGHHLGRPGRPPRRPAHRRRPDHRRRGRVLPGQVRHQIHRARRRPARPDHRRQRHAPTPTPRTHQGRLIAACLKLGAHPHEDFQALRRWAHMLGYRGHFATKSRRYSTTMRALRAARRDWQRRQHPLTLTLTQTRPSSRTPNLEWAGRGWRTSGDALLALSAAARAREHRRVAREESATTS